MLIKKKHVLTYIENLKLEKSYCFIVNFWYIVMAYKQMFNKHVLETIQICDTFLYSYL